MSAYGIAVRDNPGSLSETKWPAPTNLRPWVKAEYQVVREMIPGQPMSDPAYEMFVDRLQALATEIGPERFHDMMLRAIDTCTHRPTIGLLRRLAGLSPRMDPHADAVAKAWDEVLRVAKRHLGRDGEGNVVLRSFLEKRGEGYVEVPVPKLPEGVLAGVRMIGGWAALQETSPEFISAKWAQFRDVVRLSADEMERYG